MITKEEVLCYFLEKNNDILVISNNQEEKILLQNKMENLDNEEEKMIFVKGSIWYQKICEETNALSDILNKKDLSDMVLYLNNYFIHEYGTYSKDKNIVLPEIEEPISDILETLYCMIESIGDEIESCILTQGELNKFLNSYNNMDIEEYNKYINNKK